MAVNGNTIQILVPVSGIATVIGSQSNVNIARDAEMLNVSDKSSTDQQFLPGLRSSTITLDAFYLAADGAQAALETAYENDPPDSITVTWNENSGTSTHYKTATAYVNSLSIAAAANGPAEASIGLTISGGWTDV